MNQKRIGNRAEEQIANIFQEYGYWVAIFPYNTNGQPCDIVALNKDNHFLVDVKHCKTDRFTFSRIEPNQWTTFDYATSLGIKNVGFIIVNERYEFKYLPYSLVLELTRNDCQSIIITGLKNLREMLK